MAALYEGLKYFRERLNRIAIEKRCDRKYKKSNDVTLAITTDNQRYCILIIFIYFYGQASL